MKAWLHVADRGKPISGKYQIVFSRNQAVEMTENNAHEIMRAAENANREYKWELVKVPGSGLFVIEGTKKQ